MDAQKPNLAPEFEGRAAPPPERVTVTLDIDADILAWLKAQPLDWQREINNAARFVMDMSSQPVPPGRGLRRRGKVGDRGTPAPSKSARSRTQRLTSRTERTRLG